MNKNESLGVALDRPWVKFYIKFRVEQQSNVLSKFRTEARREGFDLIQRVLHGRKANIIGN
jgi:hypothetical protein